MKKGRAVYGVLLGTLAALALLSCGKGGGGAVQTYMVTPNEITSNGCLNVQLLFARIKSFGADVEGRRVTTDVKINSVDANNGSFLTLLARSAYRYDEKKFAKIMDFTDGVQSDCSKATLVNEEGDTHDFKITQSSDNSLTMQQDDGTSIGITMLDTTSFKLDLSYAAIDPCNNEAKAKVDTTQIIRWGKAETTNINQEQVSADMLRAVASTCDTVPNGIRDAMNAGGTVLVSVGDLKMLKDSPLRTDLTACFPPPPLEIPPPEMPTPAPTPDSSAGATPTATPAPVHH